MQIATFDPTERLLMDYINRARFYGPGTLTHRTILDAAAKMLDSKLAETPRDARSQARLWAVLNREWLRKADVDEKVQVAG